MQNYGIDKTFFIYLPYVVLLKQTFYLLIHQVITI